jgi:hypothetical protein
MKSKAHPLRRSRSHACWPITHGEDAVKRSARRQRLDARLGILEPYGGRVVAPRILQDMAAIGREDQFYVERASGLGELAHLIPGGRGEE